MNEVPENWGSTLDPNSVSFKKIDKKKITPLDHYHTATMILEIANDLYSTQGGDDGWNIAFNALIDMARVHAMMAAIPPFQLGIDTDTQSDDWRP